MGFSDHVEYEDFQEKLNNLSDEEFMELAQNAGFKIVDKKQSNSVEFDQNVKVTRSVEYSYSFSDLNNSFDLETGNAVRKAA